MSKLKTVLLFIVITLSLLLASCQPTPVEETQPPEEPPAEEEEPQAEESTLEIFSWWTAGGEAEGLNAMFEVYSGMYPEVEIINATVAGGAGTNAKAVLATRLQGGDPPDSFQVHAGLEILKYEPNTTCSRLMICLTRRFSRKICWIFWNMMGITGRCLLTSIDRMSFGTILAFLTPMISMSPQPWKNFLQ